MAIFTASDSSSLPEPHTTDLPDANNKVYLPLSPPDGIYSEHPQEKLTEAEQEKYDTVCSHFNNSEYKLPGFEDVESFKEKLEEFKKKEGLEGERRQWTTELIDEEKFWLSYECILR
jgi:hypothetical protein